MTVYHEVRGQVADPGPAPRILSPDTLQHLAAIGEISRSCVFVTSVRSGAIVGLTGGPDASMSVFGQGLHEPQEPSLPGIHDSDVPALQRQVAAALSGHAPVPSDYRYGHDHGAEPVLRLLLRVVPPRELPVGIEYPALIGVSHRMSLDRTAPGQLAEEKLFTALFQRWICACGSERAIIEDAIEIAAAAVRVVSSRHQREKAAVLCDQAAVEFRLAAEIHDGICQHLATAAGILSVVTSAVDAGDLVRARAQLGLARHLVDEAMVESRHAISELQPPALDGVALPTALRRLSATAGPPDLLVDIDEQVTLPAHSCSHVYRIAQEALANVRKHARATLVEVALLDRGRDVQLVVRDDGCGFSPSGQAARGPGAFGLLSMKGRAFLLGAQLEIASAPGSGTRIDLRTPKVTQA